MSPNDWAAIGLVVTLIVAWIGTLHKRMSGISDPLTSLPNDFVPRQQIDKRFAELERRWESEFKRLEGRSEKQFDQVNAKLDRIMDLLQHKADK